MSKKLTTVTSSSFIRPGTGLAYDVEVAPIRVDEDGFYVKVFLKFKNTNGTLSDEIEPRMFEDFIPKASASTLHANIITAITNRVNSKFP